ncbi:serine-rich and transmembrane domain-containing protein 1 isoform X1 [Anolis carolinensis]|uniref:serine-rich and transmembrane domain-containing protein 1 isoform X1 n=1 Tax=Anolis carolinensis TaxID=28377 RepID=UPI002F2B5211
MLLEYGHRARESHSNPESGVILHYRGAFRGAGGSGLQFYSNEGWREDLIGRRRKPGPAPWLLGAAAGRAKRCPAGASEAGETRLAWAGRLFPRGKRSGFPPEQSQHIAHLRFILIKEVKGNGLY